MYCKVLYFLYFCSVGSCKASTTVAADYLSALK